MCLCVRVYTVDTATLLIVRVVWIILMCVNLLISKFAVSPCPCMVYMQNNTNYYGALCRLIMCVILFCYKDDYSTSHNEAGVFLSLCVHFKDEYLVINDSTPGLFPITVCNFHYEDD